MIRRFSLYGFLKNQRYFEDWWLLAFLAKGVTFTEWGLLVGFREVMINLMEVPSGAIADLFGRRKSMLFSFAAYIVSFVIFGAADGLPLLFLGMAFFGLGEAFRTGTHKAMIFTWLQLQGRTHEKTRTYGYTRSWSQYGSAVSVVIAAVIVFATRNYQYVFYVTVIPYLAGMVNFLGYPKALDGEVAPDAKVSLRSVMVHLKDSLLVCARKPRVRRVLLESMGWAGVYKAVKDYIQPILKASAVLWLGSLVVTEGLTKEQQTALLVGPVFLCLYLLAAVGSRNVHRLVKGPDGEEHTSRLLWAISLGVFIVLIPSTVFCVRVVMILGFVALYVLQNLWRPVLVSRFDTHSSHAQKATILSIESQAGSLATAVLAPIVGYVIDVVRTRGACVGGGEFWPIGVLGTLVALAFFLTAKPAAE
ncbi:MAG TPA: MFS transporter [Planctomycetota bacterium]|nr:MFS transporter [Planctomycetota bacterium]